MLMNDEVFKNFKTIVISEKKISPEMIAIFRNRSLALKNGFCPILSRFFNFHAFGGKSSAYYLTHPEYSREYKEREKYLKNIIPIYKNFNNALSENSQKYFNSFINIVTQTTDIEDYSEIIDFKEKFEFCFCDLKGLEESEISQRYYIEKEIILEIWHCIIDNLKRHSSVDNASISAEKDLEKQQVVITIKDSTTIDLERFIRHNSSLLIYSKIKKYGYMEIQTGDQILDILSGYIYKTDHLCKYSEIRIVIKIPLTVKESERLKKGVI